jgi:hypothetical protein
MKAFILVFLFTLAAAPALAETITPSEAPSHVGEHVVREGVVTEVHHARSGRAAFKELARLMPIPSCRKSLERAPDYEAP